jgi:hypothetical protein
MFDSHDLSCGKTEADMTMSKYGVLCIVGCALVVVTAAMVSGGQSPTKKTTEQTLTATDGTKIVATVDGKEFKAFTQQGTKRTPLRDGEYKLPNNGAIRVKGGKVIWDAFGAVDKVKRTGVPKDQGVPALG